MRLLRVPLSFAEPGLSTLPAEASAYVTRVHRLGPGDRFVAFDPERAVEADAELVEVTRKGALVRVEAIRPARVRPERRVTLIQGVCKGEKMDCIVRDATELGAIRIAPVIAERSVSRPAPSRAERWRRIALEAARQSGRGDVPVIDPPAKLGAALPGLTPVEGDAAFCLDPAAEPRLGPKLAALLASAGLAILVGPEGGLEEAELVVAEQAGFVRVSLGGLVLRTETVCAAVLGAILVGATRS